jgi:undecaprenyl-diphosphatase
MEIIKVIILGVVQGLTEFIPVSSSGHLVILHEWLEVDGGLIFDVALHIGTLLALVVYFWRDIVDLGRGFFGKGKDAQVVWMIVLATIPAVISGVLLASAADSAFRSPRLVSINLIIVAGLMLLAEHVAEKRRRPSQLEKVTLKQALAMGAAQAIAVVPGVSRSGSTITAGLFAGVDRVAATRFSFLLAIPITLGAILKVLLTSDAAKVIGNDPNLFIIGIISAFLSGVFAIRFLLRYLSKHSLAAFAYYRIALGVGTLLILWLA